MLNYQLYTYVKDAIIIPESTYFYRDNFNGIMHKTTSEKIEKAIDDYIYGLNLFITN